LKVQFTQQTRRNLTKKFIKILNLDVISICLYVSLKMAENNCYIPPIYCLTNTFEGTEHFPLIEIDSFHPSLLIHNTGLLIGCGKKRKILRHLQGKLCGKKGPLCGKLCDFFKA